MPSPFPGMDPYLEHADVFHDFHQDFITAIKHAIVPQIRPGYIAMTDFNVYIHELSGEERLVGRPDVRITESPVPSRENAATVTASVTAPITSSLLPAVDVIEIPYVKIMDRGSRQVVTVIEILSPTNKLNTSDRAAYMAKRNAYRRSAVHFIEIDLLRAGEPMPLVSLPRSDYSIVLSRHETRPEVSVWPVSLRQSLPTIPVPLKSTDADASLDLQGVFNVVFDASSYADHIYATPPVPPLSDDDARWAAGLLREAGITPR
jgi:hypothetical protein